MLRKLPVSDHVVDYAVNLARATRPKEPGTPAFINEWLTWGAGPRAAQYLVLGAKAQAILDGRLNVSCDDVKRVAKPVLRHRLFTNFNADAEGIGAGPGDREAPGIRPRNPTGRTCAVAFPRPARNNFPALRNKPTICR